MNALESQCVESLHRESEQWPTLPVPKEETLLVLPRTAKPTASLPTTPMKLCQQKVSRATTPVAVFAPRELLTPLIHESSQVCKVNSITEPQVYSPSHFLGRKQKKWSRNFRNPKPSTGTPIFGRSLGKGLLPSVPLKFRLRSMYTRRKPAVVNSLASPMQKPRVAGFKHAHFNRR